MAIITLTTDLGLKDHYVAVIKGAILGQEPTATIIDVSHLIRPFDNSQAAHVLRNAYPAFPEGTIHIVGVNPEADGQTVHLVVKHAGHFFIGADNGIFPLMFEGMPQEAYELTMKLDNDHVAFPTKSVFVKAACHIARGGTPATIGRRFPYLREMIGFQPATNDKSIRARVVYIDSYGNVMTNVVRSVFDEIGHGRPFRIGFGHSVDDITQLHRTYGEVSDGVCMAFFNSGGQLEIAVNKGVEGAGGGAARLLGLRENDTIRIDFSERAAGDPKTLSVATSSKQA